MDAKPYWIGDPACGLVDTASTRDHAIKIATGHVSQGCPLTTIRNTKARYGDPALLDANGTTIEIRRYPRYPFARPTNEPG